MNKEFLNYSIDGEGDLNLVWIHGFGGDLHIWDRTLPAFSNYRNLRFDCLGHGQSYKQVDPKIAVERTVELAAELIEKEITGPIVWIGHSFAGNLISPLVNRFPSTKGAVFLDCSCLISGEARNSRKQTATKWLATADHKKPLLEFYDTLIGPNLDHKSRDSIKVSLDKCDPEFLIQLYLNFRTVPEKPKTQFPALLLESEHFSAKEDSRSFIQYYPSAKRELLKGAYHFFFHEFPDKYNQCILEFIQNSLN